MRRIANGELETFRQMRHPWRSAFLKVVKREGAYDSTCIAGCLENRDQQPKSNDRNMTSVTQTSWSGEGMRFVKPNKIVGNQRWIIIFFSFSAGFCYELTNNFEWDSHITILTDRSLFVVGYLSWFINRSWPAQLLRASSKAPMLSQWLTRNRQGDELRLVRVACGHQRHSVTWDTGRGRSCALVPAVVPGVSGPSVAAYRPVP